MSDFTLVLANRNYSSWSLRAWLVMKQTGAAFEEVMIPLDTPDTKPAIRAWSAAGKVPVLRHGERRVWDSLAIAEYLAERFPEAGLWPEAEEARAVARSAVAEMHSGFVALRRMLPMNMRARRACPADDDVETDIRRILSLWEECRARFATSGPYLFGAFTIADAFYAPVASRFVTYGVDLPEHARTYVSALWEHPGFGEWLRLAEEEPWVIDRL